MAKSRPLFFCSACGHESGRWHGRCPACDAWNSFSEAPAAGASAPPPRNRVRPAPLAGIETATAARIPSGSLELDLLLGGGIVPGSAVLLGGEPGIGKSTLLLQTAGLVAAAGKPVLYVSAEESAGQIKLRADRIGVAGDGLSLLADGSLDAIEEACRELAPALLVVDSIQAVADRTLAAPAGSLSQVRQCAARLIELAKTSNAALCLAGHITKEGALAGPKALEHMVDTVLYFEGARDRETRLLRSVKNRFGGVNELGVFAMEETGLREVHDPSCCFLEHRNPTGPGAALTASLQGNRVLLAEIQALVTDSVFSNVGRTSDGIEPNRVLRIKAIIDRRVGIPLAANDVFINVTGGLRLAEPGVDLAIAVAVAGSRTGRAAPAIACVGEISLLGELRRITQPAKRIAQARKLGLPTMLLPEANRSDCENTDGIELLFAKTLADALAIALPG